MSALEPGDFERLEGIRRKLVFHHCEGLAHDFACLARFEAAARTEGTPAQAVNAELVEALRACDIEWLERVLLSLRGIVDVDDDTPEDIDEIASHNTRLDRILAVLRGDLGSVERLEP
jgi:hypothetical protein